jgi:hypothetical protein
MKERRWWHVIPFHHPCVMPHYLSWHLRMTCHSMSTSTCHAPSTMPHHPIGMVDGQWLGVDQIREEFHSIIKIIKVGWQMVGSVWLALCYESIVKRMGRWSMLGLTILGTCCAHPKELVDHWSSIELGSMDEISPNLILMNQISSVVIKVNQSILYEKLCFFFYIFEGH